MTYDKLLDLRRKHLKKLAVCGRSKRWWSSTIATQVAVVKDHCRRHGRNKHWVRERFKLDSLIQEGKRKCWDDFWTKSGEKSQWEVVRWVKGPCRLKERMGRLRSTDGRWLESNGDKVDGLVSDLFGGDTGDAAGNAGGQVECPYNEDEVMGWVRDALSGTRNNFAASPDGVGYKLIKAIWDTKLGTEVLGEIVAALRGGYIRERWRDMRVVLILKPGRDLTQTKN